MTTFPPIEELLLHRDNMLLLKEVTAFSDDAATCLSIPDADAWYASAAAGAMPAWIGIELMAQAIAAHVALLARRDGKAPKAGVLLGTRDFRSAQPAFAGGRPLLVHACQSFRNADGLASYDCRIESEQGEELAAAALTVYEPDNFEQFISGITD